jgi:hypothetical protein
MFSAQRLIRSSRMKQVLSAAFYHDHIFVGAHDTEKAMQVLHRLSQDPSASTR